MKGSKEIALGVDCGGTNLKLALVRKTGEILRSRQDPIDYQETPEKTVSKMARRFKAFLKQCRAAHVESIGMGVAGDIDQAKGVVRFSPNLGWKNVPLRELLSKEIDQEILIDNDANCAAWGAYCLDAKRDCENLVCLTLGTGVGGGLILNRKLYRGSTGSAGELGHMSVQSDGRPCKCGSFGCVESMVGAWGMIEIAEEGLQKGLAPILEKILRRSKKARLSPKTIEEAALRGDPYCKQLWWDTGQKLGCALTNIVNVLNPDRIILCGGVCKVGSLLLDPALHTLGARAFKTPAQRVKVTISGYNELLGVVGAALLHWE